MTKKTSAIRQLLVPVAALLFSSLVATPASWARTIEAPSAACELPDRWEAPSKDLKRTIDHYGQQSALANKCSPVSNSWRQSREPLRPQLMPVSLMLPRFSQPGVCESPLRNRFFQDEVHVGLGCDDRIFDQPTALDGFARMRYHIPVPR